MEEQDKRKTSLSDVPIEIIIENILCHLNLKNCVYFHMTCRYYISCLTEERMIQLQQKEREAVRRKVYENMRKEYLIKSASRSMFEEYLKQLKEGKSVMAIHNSPLYNCFIGNGYEPKAEMPFAIELNIDGYDGSKSTSFYDVIGSDFIDILIISKQDKCEFQEFSGVVNEYYPIIEMKENTDVGGIALGKFETDVSCLISKMKLSDIRNYFYPCNFTSHVDSSQCHIVVRMCFFSKLLSKQYMAKSIQRIRDKINELASPHGYVLPTEIDTEL